MGSSTRYPSYDYHSYFNRITNHTCKSRYCIRIHPTSAPASNNAPRSRSTSIEPAPSRSPLPIITDLKAKGANVKAKAPAPAPVLNRTPAPPTKPLESIPERRSLIQAASAVTTLSAREES
ncbi:hypothetical protein M422DRAFT_40090, partial [Sphaerobolus stellatus SS14]